MTNTLRVAAILFSLVFSFVLWQEQSIEAFAQGTAEVTANSGKIREKASTDSTVLASVKKGDSLDVTASTTDSAGYTWYKVFVNGQSQGYIRGDLVSVEGTIPAEAAGSSTTGSSAASGSTASGGGGNVTTVGSGGNVTTVGSGQSTTTAAGNTDSGDTATAMSVSPSQVVRAKVTEQVRVRKGPGTKDYDVVGSANAATEVTVSGEAVDGEGKTWYQVSFSQSGSTVNGFIREDFLEILETAAPETEEVASAEEPVEEEAPVNEDFYLKYVQNEAGEWDWYLFDQVQGTSQSLTQLLSAVAQIEESAEAEKGQASTMKIIIIVMAVVLVLLVVAVTVLLFKLHDSYEEYDEDEEEDEEEAEEDEEEEEPVSPRSLKSRFGRRAQRVVEEEDEDEEEEEVRESRTSGRQGKKKNTPEEKGTWQSKDFLELDDDMEFEFLDL